MRGDEGDAPDWFTTALAAPYDEVVVDTPEVRLTGRAWGPAGAPLVLLVHGGAAHSGWWHHVGPHLAGARRVVAVDLSGHGDSSWTDHYSFEGWARDLRAVAAAEGGTGRPWIVGHSMGGMVALASAAAFGHELSGVICVDLPDEVLRDRQVPTVADLPARVARDTRDEVVARFRVRPEDPACKPYVRDRVARESVRRRPDGWSWKFDPVVTTHARFDRGLLDRAGCPVALVAAERGLLTASEVDEVAGRLARDTRVTWITNCGHHVMLDQPMAMVDALFEHLDGSARKGRLISNSCV